MGHYASKCRGYSNDNNNNYYQMLQLLEDVIEGEDEVTFLIIQKHLK